jgi:oligosaccharide repeat unit polymerase
LKKADYSSILISPFFLLLLISIAAIAANLKYFSNWSFGHTLYSLGVFTFLISYSYVILIFGLSGVVKRTVVSFPLDLNYKILKIYFVLGAIGAVIGFILIVSRGGGGEGLFFNLRYAHTYDEKSSYGASHLALFSLVVSGVSLLNGNYKLAFIYFVSYLIPSLATAERTSILYGFSFLAYLGLSARRLKLRVILGSVFILFILFYIIAFSSGKLYSDEVFFVLPYFAYGISAFNDWVSGLSNVGCSSLVFGTSSKVLDFFSNKVSCSETDLAPDGFFNVYTYVMNPYVWGGVTGLVSVMAVLGFVYALFRIFEKRSVYFLFLNASLVFSILMTFYAWTFSLTTHLYMAIILVPIFVKFSLGGKSR